MTAIERQMAADAIALSKEHADRADAASERWKRLREYVTAERAAQERNTAVVRPARREWQTERACGAVEALDRLTAWMDQEA